MTFEELSEKKKKMEDACASYKEAVRTFLEQCVKDAGLSNTRVRLKSKPELVGRLYVEDRYNGLEIVFRKITKNGNISCNISYVSGLSFCQWFDKYPKLPVALTKLFEPVGDSE